MPAQALNRLATPMNPTSGGLGSRSPVGRKKSTHTMPQTYTELFYHLIWATRGGEPSVTENLRIYPPQVR